jgi:hypothetical protein
MPRSSPSKPRYRIENGRPCIDVSVPSIKSLFDNRDPAPFRQRDLDPELITYLIGASEDLVSRVPLEIVFWLQDPCAPGEIEDAVRAHFDYEIERLDRRRRNQRRTGLVGLGLAVVIISALLSLAAFLGDAVGGWFGSALRESLVIASWVLMWRPIDTLVYDWIPWRRERRAFIRLREATIEMRSGKPPI